MLIYLTRVILLSACVIMMAGITPTQTIASQTTPIKIGVYNFPPIAMVDEHNQPKGFLADLLNEFKNLDENLSFRILHTSPKRRHLDFQSGLFDVMFFEHPDWNWQPLPVKFSDPILRDEEVYVALNKENRDQSFFKNISERRIVAIAGYHYGFAGLETNSAELSKRFQIEFSHSHQRNLDLIRADRPTIAEVGIVSRSFLNIYFSRFPERRDDFLVSEIVDQSYELHIVTRKNGPVRLEILETLLQQMIDSGRYQKLVSRYGLQLPRAIAEHPDQRALSTNVPPARN